MRFNCIYDFFLVGGKKEEESKKDWFANWTLRSWDVKKRNKRTRWKRGKKQLNVDGRVCYMLIKRCLDFQRQIKHVNILSYLGNWLCCKILCDAITLQGASIQTSDKPGSVGEKAWNLNGCFPGLQYSESSHFPIK